MGTQRQIDMKFDLSYPSEHPKFIQRLGEKLSTDITVQIFNKGVPYDLKEVSLGFEMRNDNDKIVIDSDMESFGNIDSYRGIFTYRPPVQVQSFFGNSYLAYFTLTKGDVRITTERFRFYNDEDVQLAIAPELQDHYVSVIDGLVESNAEALQKAQEIKDMIDNNQVVKKTGDIMVGSLVIDTTRVADSLSISFQDENGMSLGLKGHKPSKTISLMDWEGGETSVWRYSHSDKKLIIDVDANVVKTTDDASIDIPLTAEAVAINPINYPNRATRRGTIVTINLALYRKADSTSTTVAMLPPSMRPHSNFYNYYLLEDGSRAYVNILTTGAVTLDVKDKQLYMSDTFVI